LVSLIVISIVTPQTTPANTSPTPQTLQWCHEPIFCPANQLARHGPTRQREVGATALCAPQTMVRGPPAQHCLAGALGSHRPQRAPHAHDIRIHGSGGRSRRSPSTDIALW